VNLGVEVVSAEPVGVVDFDYLLGFVAGDKAVVLEVLSLFCEQAEAWTKVLDPADSGWRDVVHTIKGAARGVGANALGDICAKAEAEGESDLPAVKAALDAAVADITAYQARG
jgi:HPt (histidine-containing phosphotransfer) domain-containing protein